MEAGSLRETIVILSPPARNRYGEIPADGTWTEFLRTRGGFTPLIGREYFAAEQAQSHVEVKFNLRYRTGIQDNFRVSHGGVIYEIVYIANVEGRNKELILYCKKKVD